MEAVCEYHPKLSWEGNMHLKHDVVWLLVWIGISRAGRNKLAKIENKVDNITKTATSVNKLKPSYSLFHSSKP